MYKIYINDTPLFLANTEEVKESLPGTETDLVARYTGKSKILLNYIDLLEKSNRYDSITIFYDNLEILFHDFISLYKVLDAGGGVVYNSKREALLIFRLGYWDLPKGKIEAGETKEAAALREVEEETGVNSLKMDEYLCTTYHTYKNRKGRRVLKRTYWYRMFTEQKELIPQTEEDIELAQWTKLSSFFAVHRKVYGNIRDILEIELKTE